jgi:uncharacterized membrane protein YccC
MWFGHRTPAEAGAARYYWRIASADGPPRRRGAPAAASRLGPWLREIVRVDRSRLAVAAAVPSAAGYSVPLVAGLAAGHVADGVAASAGALIVGFANLGGRYRVRSATLLAATVAAGVAVLAGGLAGPSGLATVALMGLWGFAAGLLVSFGTRAAFVGMLSTWALLLAGDLNLHGKAVLHEAWLITAGGLVQTAIAIAAWPLRPFAAERRAVADAYRTLAACARAPGTAAFQDTAAALAAAAETVGEGPALPGERGTLRALVEQGEWVRLELAALARSDGPGTDRSLDAAADALDAIAAGGDPAPSRTELMRSAGDIDDPVARRRAASLAAWISAAACESRAGAPGPAPRPRRLEALRAECTLRSSAFRHALRLSAALIVAGMVYRGLSLGSGYWVPLTVLFVLKPDYGTTMARGTGRAAGTMAGVTIAWAIVTLFSPADATIVVLLALLACAAYALFPASYALFSVILTVLVALLAEFSGGSPVGALADRIIDTAVGTIIALAAVTLWPTRETPQTLECLAGYVTAEGRWLDAILNAYAGGDDLQSVRSTRLAARRARMAAWDAVRRAAAEPPRRRPDDRPLRGLLAAMDQISECALVLAAAMHDGARAPREALVRYRAALDGGFAETASWLHSGARPPLVPQREPAPDADRRDPALAAVATEADAVLATLEAARAQLTRSADNSAHQARKMQIDHADRRNCPDPTLDQADQHPDDGR